MTSGRYSAGRLEALSFTLGYMLHYCGDMFGHDFVNMFSGGTFPNLTDVDYLDSKNPELNNVLSHMAIEAQMDKFVNENVKRAELKSGEARLVLLTKIFKFRLAERPFGLRTSNLLFPHIIF